MLTHFGDFGDIIYSLPAVRAIQESTLILCPGPSMHGMDIKRFDTIAPLLRAQGLKVEYSGAILHSRLTRFRDYLSVGNLADAHLVALGVSDFSVRNTRWLHVPGKMVPDTVCLARSTRYHNAHFPWVQILHKIRDMGLSPLFIGTHEEFEGFCQEFNVSCIRADTKDLLEVAKTIVQSEYFVGNQSAPAAIAEGLKHPRMLLERATAAPRSCNFERFGLLLGSDGNVDVDSFFN